MPSSNQNDGLNRTWKSKINSRTIIWLEYLNSNLGNLKSEIFEEIWRICLDLFAESNLVRTLVALILSIILKWNLSGIWLGTFLWTCQFAPVWNLSLGLSLKVNLSSLFFCLLVMRIWISWNLKLTFVPKVNLSNLSLLYILSACQYLARNL